MCPDFTGGWADVREEERETVERYGHRDTRVAESMERIRRSWVLIAESRRRQR